MTIRLPGIRFTTGWTVPAISVGSYTTPSTPITVSPDMSAKRPIWLPHSPLTDGAVISTPVAASTSSPPGVRICGTQLSDNSASQAIALAENIMSTCYPDWHQTYPDCAVNYSYLTSSSKIRWSTGTLRDANLHQGMSADDIVTFLLIFPKKMLSLFLKYFNT